MKLLKILIINTSDPDKLIKVNALIKRASIYIKTDKIKDCLEDYDKAVELGAGVSDVFHPRGQVKLSKKLFN